jgi:dipeptidyl aminopeptidase/acylaminoacyl peptidase
MSGLEDSMGGADKLNEMIKEAQTNGSVKYNDLFGGQKELSKEYFMDMEAHDVLKALSHYKHNLLIVQGNEDDIVRPDVIDKALTHINKECHFNYLYMDHANHGFGLWDDHPEQSEKLVKETIKFIERHL